MKQIIQKVFVFSLLCPGLYLTGCMDKPEDFIAPKWDVSLNSPVIDTTYTLEDALEKDDSMIKWYPAGSPKANLLYYADRLPIEKVTVGDNLKLDASIQSTQAATIGDVKIQNPASRSGQIGTSWTGASSGASVPIPAVSNIPVELVFPTISEFNYVKLSSGSLDLSLKNVMPVNIVLSGCVLENTSDKSVIGEIASNITITPGNTITIPVPLKSGVTISNSLAFRGSLSTPGSGGNFVTIPDRSIDISASFNNLAVNEVQGKVKASTISINNSFQIDNETMFQQVEIAGGNLQLTLNNNLDVALNAKIRLLNLYSSIYAASPYEINMSVGRKSSKPLTQDLSNFVLKSDNATNVISYEVLVSTEGPDDYRTIKSTDNVSETISMSQLSVRSFKGIIKPTKLEIKPKTVTLDLGEVKDKFHFNKITFKDPDLKLYLNPSSQFKAKIEGVVSAKGSNATLKFTDYISRNGNQVDSLVEIPKAEVANFLSSFSPSLPTELTISGTATVNPDNESCTIAQSDSLTGATEISFPLNVGVSDGDFTDTTEIRLKDKARDEVSKLQSIALTMEITNGLPASVKYEGVLLDTTKMISLLQLPTNGQVIEVPAAKVDADGKVVASSSVTQVVEFTGGDVDKFAMSHFLISKVKINTSGATTGSAAPVEFKITDSIKIKAWVKATYRVNE